MPMNLEKRLPGLPPAGADAIMDSPPQYGMALHYPLQLR